jgi:hypothetical protein
LLKEDWNDNTALCRTVSQLPVHWYFLAAPLGFAAVSAVIILTVYQGVIIGTIANLLLIEVLMWPRRVLVDNLKFAIHFSFPHSDASMHW